MGEVPLYERVRQAIAASIADGTYAPGDKVPERSHGWPKISASTASPCGGPSRSSRGPGQWCRGRGRARDASAPIVRLPLSQRLSTDSLVAGLTGQIAEHGLTYEDVLLRAAKVNTPHLNATLELPPVPCGGSTTL